MDINTFISGGALLISFIALAKGFYDSHFSKKHSYKQLDLEKDTLDSQIEQINKIIKIEQDKLEQVIKSTNLHEQEIDRLPDFELNHIKGDSYALINISESIKYNVEIIGELIGVAKDDDNKNSWKQLVPTQQIQLFIPIPVGMTNILELRYSNKPNGDEQIVNLSVSKLR
jgi:hypothetical protein